MPIRKTDKGYYWGSKGPFETKQKAEEVMVAAYASGYRPKKTINVNEKKKNK